MPLPNEYDFGTTVDIVVKFRARPTDPFTGQPGALTNPSSVTGTLEDPNGSETALSSFTNPTTGIFYKAVTLNKVGIWRYKVNGDGVIKEGKMICKPSVFAEGA